MCIVALAGRLPHAGILGTQGGSALAWLIAALWAIGSGPAVAAADAGPAPAGWWQFDRILPLADETNAADLDGAPVPLSESAHGIELSLELRAAPAVATSLAVLGSEDAAHWSAAADGLTVALLLEARSPVAGGAVQRLVGRGPASGGKGGGWRLDLRPTAPDSCTLEATVQTVAGPVSLDLALAVDAPRLVVLDLDPAGGEVRLESRTTTGRVIASAAAPLATAPLTTTDPFVVGAAGGPSGDVAVTLDLVAGWAGPLPVADRDRLATADGPARFATYQGWAGVGEPGHRLERMAGIMSGDRRHVIVGDSFVFAAGYSRVYPAMLRVARFEPFTAVATGVRELNALLGFTFSIDDPAGANPRDMEPLNEYRCEYLGGADPQDFYGLPTNRVVELRGHPGASIPADGRLMEVRTLNGVLQAGDTGPLSLPGDPVAFRLVHRRLSDAVPPLPAVRLTDAEDSVSVTVDLTAGVPRQASSTDHRFTSITGADGEASVTVREPMPGAFAAPGERFANLVSMMAWRVDEAGARLPGQYFTSLHDTSWTWLDYGQDFETNGGGNDKAISREQLMNWLGATTLDADQPITFWWYMDMEPLPLEEMTENVRAAIDIADAAALEAGLPRPGHLLVVPHLHQRGGRTYDRLLFAFDTYRAAFDAVVDDPAYDHVARYSIMDATDAVLFDGRPEAIAWLADRGYDAFTYGEFSADLTAEPTLLDPPRVHPSNPPAAAFFASFLVAGLEDAASGRCVGDVTADGLVDFDDLVAVIGAWGPCPGPDDCPADLDASGDVGIADLLVVLGNWNLCSPGG